MIDKTKIPDEALYILNNLNDLSYESYICGGAIRDILLNKSVKDFDITTQALPEEVIDIFKEKYKVLPTGIEHGTVTVMVNKIPIEVTTFRVDGEYSNGRKPDLVEFIRNVKNDVDRRDFTINGLLFNGQDVIDYVGGLSDLNNKKIRAIGNADDRFIEDALRMMRCIRFSCQLGFNIVKSTIQSIERNSELIQNVSQERIHDELIKILMSDKPSKGIGLLAKTNLLKFIIPELQECVGFDQYNTYHRKNVFDHILKVLENTPTVLNVRLAALFHDISKPETFTMGEDGCGHFYSHHKVGADKTREIMKRLKFDNETIDNVCILIYEHMSRYPKLREGSVKKLLRRLGEHNVDDLINLQIADIIGSKPPFDFEDIVMLKKELKRVIDAKEPISVNHLVINGNDIMKEYSLKPSRAIGLILNNLLEYVLEYPENNTRDILFEQVDNFLMNSNSK